jgi:hypothetical protein
MQQVQLAIQDMVTDPKKQRRKYNAILVRVTKPLVQDMRSHITSGTSAMRLVVKKPRRKGDSARFVQQVRLRDSINSRAISARYTGTDPGVHIGPQRKSSSREYTRHWHLYAFGTKKRKTKSGANRGTMPENNYAAKTFAKMDSTLNVAMNACFDQVMTALDKSLAKRGLNRRAI